MSVSGSEVLDIKKFFKDQHIVVSSEWIEACAAFVKQEHSGLQLSTQRLRNYVYEQFLAADLEEIQVPVLPRDLLTVQKTTLNGPYVLQVDGIKDVSKPAYSQLKQLENSVNTNEEFSATPRASVPEWEAKPTRMLMLRMTDGCSFIQGMEYKPIPFLSPNLPPGVKVVIQGPLDCRLGVVLLTADKIKVLGGEVESKLQQFSRLALLREALQIPNSEENGLPENPESVPNSSPSRSTNANDVPNSAPRQSHTNVQRSHVNLWLNPPTSGHSRNSSNSIRNRDVVPHLHQGTSSSSGNNRNQVPEFAADDNFFDSDDDDFTQSLDLDAIDELEKENSQRPVQLDYSDSIHDENPMWEEDEDMMQEMMAFEENPPEFEMPVHEISPSTSSSSRHAHYDIKTKPFTYLSVVLADRSCTAVVTVKGFIISVLSKLECTTKQGWSLSVKINDGTATVDADIHDKVLEQIIGISALDMMKMQTQAAQDMQKKREVMGAISKCRTTLQNYSCLMDVKFMPGEKPVIVQFSPVGELELKQLFERVSSDMSSK
ncbi:recQ-mediated genome instability protein 1-like [Uloborus diversus]|uniref:recQ-mediated genome instability protein 1-like n=1 Tax=Uloborus diversus TaxID=327109 RepID=UPI002409454B|nr:recQ-mediated genome instability protein 1-like [Uloborus diversus]